MGNPVPQVTWYHNGHPIPSGGRFCITRSGDLCQLHISHVEHRDAGAVKISALNKGGEAICIADLLVAPADSDLPPVDTREQHPHALSHNLLYLKFPSIETESDQQNNMVSNTAFRLCTKPVLSVSEDILGIVGFYSIL